MRQRNNRHGRFQAVLTLLFLAETMQGQTLTAATVRGGGGQGEASVVDVTGGATSTTTSTANTSTEDHVSYYAYPDNDPKCFETTQELRDAVNQYQGEAQFDQALAARYGWPLQNWCVSHIGDFSNLFQSKHHRYFDEDLNDWDMSSATDLSGMFQNCHWFNRPLSQWNVSNVRTTARMFAAARTFHQDLSRWTLDRCEDMSYMFLHAFSLEHQHVTAWKDHIQNVRTMEGMFRDARSFDASQLTWDVSHVANTKGMVSSISGVSLNLRGGSAPIVTTASSGQHITDEI